MIRDFLTVLRAMAAVLLGAVGLGFGLYSLGFNWIEPAPVTPLDGVSRWLGLGSLTEWLSGGVAMVLFVAAYLTWPHEDGF